MHCLLEIFAPFEIFSLEEKRTTLIYSGGENMRNASGPQGEIERQRKKVNRNSYDISSIKRVTRI